MSLHKTTKSLFKTLFQKRSVIIVSGRGTSHVSLSGRIQGLFLIGLVSVVGLGSYTTGQYMAAKEVLASQDETLNTLANSHVQRSFSFLPPSLTPNDRMASSQSGAAADMALSAMDENKLLARIAYLEGRERELQKQNEQIMVSVREKTRNHLASLESVIRATGLEPDVLAGKAKRESHESSDVQGVQEDGSAEQGAQGGPFIPENSSQSMKENIKIFDKELAEYAKRADALKGIVRALPLVSPVKQASLESRFGSRADPFTGRMAFHAGLDLAAPSGAEVYATSAGKVSEAEYRGAYGNMVEVQHNHGISTRYAHLSRIDVVPGQLVTKGQKLGVQGSTGRSTGPHVHYEVRYNDRPVNPIKFINAGKMYVSQNK